MADGAAVAILRVDREKTAIEEEATRRVFDAMFTDQPVHYDEALGTVRRENLRVVRGKLKDRGRLRILERIAA